MEEKIKAKPEELPNPTYWPFLLAFGVVLLFWGILTSWIITGIGFLLFAVALGGWIMDIFEELLNND